MHDIEPVSQLPPLALVTSRQHWRPPFVYSPDDVETLMTEAAHTIALPLRAAPFQTLIGLLAITGMRVGEAIRLDRSDIDWSEGVIVVSGSKFNKSRELPLHSSTVHALASSAGMRDRWQPQPKSSTFFVSMRGTPVCYADFGEAFRKLLATSGIGAGSSVRPRIHDLRHSFAVHTLVGWYREGQDVGALLPRLSTYMGHRDPSSTYWYLSAAPELL